MPVLPASEITLVTDSRICSKALSAYNARHDAQGPGASSAQVIVVKAGEDRYLVMEPTVQNDEYQQHMVMDSRFKVLDIGGT
jgi:hypothetical protein